MEGNRTMKTIATVAASLIGMLMTGVMAEGRRASTPLYAGVMTGNAEKDSFGFQQVDLIQEPNSAIVLSKDAQYVGLRFGSEEKDTFAYINAEAVVSLGQ
jgi:hypothetical protein